MDDAPTPRFRLEADSIPPETRVLSFHGRERAGRPYVFDIVLAVPWSLPPDAAAAALFDQRAVLSLSDHPDARRIGGKIARLAFAGTLERERYALQVRLVPGLALLRRRRMSRIFQELSIPEVIAAVLGLHRLPLRLALSPAHPPRQYCVQHRETDLDFVLRLTQEEGLILTFDDPAEGRDEETVVLWDGGAAHGPIRGRAALSVREADADQAMSRREHDVHQVHVERRGAPQGLLAQAYDPMRPRVRIVSGAATNDFGAFTGSEAASADKLPGKDDPSLVYEHHGDYERIDIDRETAPRFLSQARRHALRVKGSSISARLAVGRTFKLTDHALASVPQDLCITALDHHGKDAEQAGKSPTYESRFAAIPASQVPLPKPARRRPAQVAETAVVVGPHNHEVHVDEYGRIKVQFHWDLDGKHDEHSSCWIRVAQAWAGEAFGTMFIPRVGMEVLVTFIGGDLDRPVVTGALYHSAHLPPFTLPAAQRKSGILTRSSPGGGGQHELSFDDSKGNELLRMSSERDLEIASKHDTRFDVSKDRSDTVGKDHLVRVAGNRSVQIDGEDSREVRGKADDSFYGDRASLTMGNTTVHAEGPVNVSLGAGAVVTSRGPMTTQVLGDHSLIIGFNNSVAQTSVTGRYAVGASQAITLRSDEAIRLQVGMTTLDITEGGIKLNGKALSFKGEEIVAEGNGPKLTLGDEAEIVSQKLSLFSKKGGLELGEEAELWGQKVKLGPPKTAPEKKAEESDEKKKPFKVELTDLLMEPYADKQYELYAEGERFSGKTSGDGGIDIEIAEKATRADITCWIDEYPTGRKKTWSVRVAELPPASTPAGALLRLHNLGYYTGKSKTELGETEKAALRWFQKEHDIEESGELTAETASELERVHGS